MDRHSPSSPLKVYNSSSSLDWLSVSPRDPPVSASAEITSVCHCPWVLEAQTQIFKLKGKPLLTCLCSPRASDEVPVASRPYQHLVLSVS